jgi:CNP1-like family
MKRLVAFVIAAIAAGAAAQSPLMPKDNVGFEEEAPWQELKEVEPPAFPRQENLLEYYVGPATANNYFIDASTLSVGSDGIVRYVLVVRTAGGATNVSFEGINCKELTWKHYATGRSDGTWVKVHDNRAEWRPIENKPVNRHHAALSRDYFCPARNPIKSAEEGRNALRLGMHPGSVSNIPAVSDGQR